MAQPSGSVEPNEPGRVAVSPGQGNGGTEADSVVSRVSATVHRLTGPARGAGWGVGALAILATGAIFAGPAGLFVAGMLLVYGIPVWAFARNQRRLTNKGSELATSVGEVQELIDSDAAAFRGVFTAILPWRTGRDVPTAPIPGRRSPPAIQPDITVIESAWSTGAVDGRAAPQSFWRALTVAEQYALRAVAQERTFAPGAVLCREGQLADHVIVIRAGWTKICVEHPAGERVIARRGPGDLVGERAALREGARSATVVAVETVQAYVVATQDFRAFLGDHPRLVYVVEGQIYGRLTEDRDPSPVSPAWTGQNCSILLTDITAFGAHNRRDDDRRAIRLVMYDVLANAFESSGVSWAACHRDDRGDGALVVVPPSTPTGSVVDALLIHLAVSLARHNRGAGEATRIQLRAALDVGPVVSDPEGVSGQAIIHAARLLESPVLKRQLAESAADLGFIVSKYVYDNIITHHSGRIDQADFQEVKFRVKESRITAWTHLIGREAASAAP